MRETKKSLGDAYTSMTWGTDTKMSQHNFQNLKKKKQQTLWKLCYLNVYLWLNSTLSSQHQSSSPNTKLGVPKGCSSFCSGHWVNITLADVNASTCTLLVQRHQSPAACCPLTVDNPAARCNHWLLLPSLQFWFSWNWQKGYMENYPSFYPPSEAREPLLFSFMLP